MTTGVTYYIAAMAGNDLNGNVDLADPCLDFSNAIEVVWYPEPSVAFSVNATDVCPDECYDIEISFTGTPPFYLKGEIVEANNTVTVIDETYLDNMGVYTWCLYPNAPIGEVVIQATGLTDGNNCVCD